MCARIFWTVYAALTALALLARLLFRLEISFWALASALLVLESGIFFLTNGFGLHRARHAQGGGTYALFHGSIALCAQSPALRAILSDAVIDLSPPPAPVTRVTCVLGRVTLRLPPGYALRTVCFASPGEIQAPGLLLTGWTDGVRVLGDGRPAQLAVTCILGRVTILD